MLHPLLHNELTATQFFSRQELLILREYEHTMHSQAHKQCVKMLQIKIKQVIKEEYHNLMLIQKYESLHILPIHCNIKKDVLLTTDIKQEFLQNFKIHFISLHFT